MDRPGVVTFGNRRGPRAKPDSFGRSAGSVRACRGAKEGVHGRTMGSPTLIYEGGEEWIGQGS